MAGLAAARAAHFAIERSRSAASRAHSGSDARCARARSMRRARRAASRAMASDNRDEERGRLAWPLQGYHYPLRASAWRVRFPSGGPSDAFLNCRPARPNARCRRVAALLAAAALAVDAATLRWAGRGDMQTTDPHSQNENLTNNINSLVYESAAHPRQEAGPRARPRRIVDAGQSDHVALQAAPRRQVPRRHAVHRRRRRVQLRARARRHVAAARVRQRLGHPEEDRRPHRRVHDQRAQPDRARAHRDDQHHEQGMVREEPRDQAAELHAEGGDDHRAPGQRHRPLFAEVARARRQDGAGQESQLVGHQGRQCGKATPTK